MLNVVLQIQGNAMSEIVEVAMKKLKPHERAAHVRFSAHELAILNFETMPPIVIDGKFNIIDGNTRYYAALDAKEEFIRCIIVKARDAINLNSVFKPTKYEDIQVPWQAVEEHLKREGNPIGLITTLELELLNRGALEDDGRVTLCKVLEAYYHHLQDDEKYRGQV